MLGQLVPKEKLVVYLESLEKFYNAVMIEGQKSTKKLKDKNE
jgi:hypothetical protein